MKVLITGATGFVGRNIVDFLMGLREPIDIVALVRNPEKGTALQQLAKPVQVVLGDLTQPESLTGLPQDLDIVIHAASLVSLRNGPEFYPVNVEGTRHLLSTLEKQTQLQRIVYISTISAVDRPVEAKAPYGPLTEASPCVPRTDYGKSKRQAEVLVEQSGLPYTILRPSYIYGPYPRQGSSADRVIQDVAQENPYTRFPFSGHISEIFVEDLADVIWRAAQSPRCKNQTYFISNLTPMAVQECFKGLYALMNKPYRAYPIPRFLLPWLKATMIKEGLSALQAEILFTDAFTCDPSKLYQHLSWRPYFGFGPGLSKTLQWYRTHGMLAERTRS